MGGYGAFYSALEHPDLYNKAFSYSGLLNILARYDNPQGLDMYPVFGDRKELIECGKVCLPKQKNLKAVLRIQIMPHSFIYIVDLEIQGLI